MKRKLAFTIPSLVAAGLFPSSGHSAPVPDGARQRTQPDLDRLDQVVVNIVESHKYTLAAHRSHRSHSSHRSHRSSTYRSAPVAPSPPSRNYRSTPPSSVLPKSYSTTKKPLPGNSAKFKTIVLRAQLALQQRGYDVGPVDGVIGAKTVAAIYKFQRDKGMVPNGRLTPEVLSSLGIIAQ